MTVTPLAIPDVKLITPKRFGDHRGFFAETYNRKLFAELGIPDEFVQDNHSLSREVGVVRGLHYQLHPFAQAKLVRVIRGAIYDVAVDIRRGSPTFGKWVGAELTADNFTQIYVPVGFAHGFVVRAPDTEVVYKVTAYYSPAHDRGIRWDDPDLAIDWGLPPEKAVLSEKDRKHPQLKDAADLFEFQRSP
ncbi:MAG: dTDP-4-dehydrorhamnose 3,5-epimerase [Tepidisphaerales bacterium]